MRMAASCTNPLHRHSYTIFYPVVSPNQSRCVILSGKGLFVVFYSKFRNCFKGATNFTSNPV